MHSAATVQPGAAMSSTTEMPTEEEAVLTGLWYVGIGASDLTHKPSTSQAHGCINAAQNPNGSVCSP